MYVVFRCRKCEHEMYLEDAPVKQVLDASLINKLNWLSKKDCPNCGEEPYDNWLLVGLAKDFPSNK